MALKNFPIGIQDFASIRNEGYFYVDKTDLVYRLTHTSKYYFLSRPRRFGKSLLISTLQCYFEGRKELFTGLAMEKLETEWKKYPVIRLDMKDFLCDDEEILYKSFDNLLNPLEKSFGIEQKYDGKHGSVRLHKLISEVHEKSKSEVVVLVDNYDVPFLKAAEAGTLEDFWLQIMGFFCPIKSLGGIIKFAILVGTCKTHYADNISGGLNNLCDIIMMDDYAALCGITKEEVLTQMQPEIQALADKQGLTYDEACAALQKQYDGYHFSKNSPDVYNPFSLINALSEGELNNYWFATGTPTILTKLVAKYQMDPVMFDEGFDATQDMFDTPTETATDPIPMLYQSGYLTIKGTKSGNRYILQFPNDEVRYGFVKSLMPYYAAKEVRENDTFLMRFADTMEDGRIDDALNLIKAFISGVPYNTTKQNENYYRTLFYFIFKLCTPYVVRTEECSAAGRADAVVETASAVYVFEFKLSGSATAEDALKQIDDKGYLIPYTVTTAADGTPKKLFKIGVSFDEEKRTIGEWVVA